VDWLDVFFVAFFGRSSRVFLGRFHCLFRFVFCF